MERNNNKKFPRCMFIVPWTGTKSAGVLASKCLISSLVTSIRSMLVSCVRDWYSSCAFRMSFPCATRLSAVPFKTPPYAIRCSLPMPCFHEVPGHFIEPYSLWDRCFLFLYCVVGPSEMKCIVDTAGYCSLISCIIGPMWAHIAEGSFLMHTEIVPNE